MSDQPATVVLHAMRSTAIVAAVLIGGACLSRERIVYGDRPGAVASIEDWYSPPVITAHLRANA